MEKYIRQALDSLLSCRHAQSIEIFVIDDGGTDHTLEIAKEYAWKHPGTVIPVHKENGGYGSTINYSIEHATGKYFKQLDGDDWFCADKLDDFICLLGNVDDDMVFSQTIEYHEDSGEETVRDVCYHFPLETDVTHLSLINSMLICQPFLQYHTTADSSPFPAHS